MNDSDGKMRLACRETGLLIFKDYCYALQCADGKELWLEMDRIPCHLTDSPVRVEGQFFEPNLVSVELIGPA